jgi:hypothetical protein
METKLQYEWQMDQPCFWPALRHNRLVFRVFQGLFNVISLGNISNNVFERILGFHSHHKLRGKAISTVLTVSSLQKPCPMQTILHSKPSPKTSQPRGRKLGNWSSQYRYQSYTCKALLFYEDAARCSSSYRD